MMGTLLRTMKRRAMTTTDATKTMAPAMPKHNAGSVAKMRPNTSGDKIRAMELIAESIPMTAPRFVGGTHCMSKIGMAGVKSGKPATYTMAAGGT